MTSSFSSGGFAFGASSSTTGLGTNGFEVSLNYLTGLPDSNILTCSSHLKLIIKSLLKRDDITREKAVVELLSYIKQRPSEIDDDLVIIAWCQLYAKLSIDNSKKVRMTSHQIQSIFVITLGKRYVKYLRDTIGSWLGGCFDSDRTTAKTCSASIEETFNHDEQKVANLWTIFMPQIIKYSSQIFLYESKNSISDERFTGKDESETKYLRVVLNSIQLLTQALTKYSNSNMNLSTDSKELLSEIIGSENYLSLFASKDFQVKKVAYQSIKALYSSKCYDLFSDTKLLNSIAKSAVRGLKFNSKVNPILYSGTVVSMLDAILTISKHNPSIWTTDSKAEQRLIDFLKFGSLNSQPVYYELLNNLLDILPNELLPLSNYKSTERYLSILQSDIKTERLPQFLAAAWKCYMHFEIKIFEQTDNFNEVYDKFVRSFIEIIDSVRVMSLPVTASLFSNITQLKVPDSDILNDITSEIWMNMTSGEISLKRWDMTIKHKDNFIQNFFEILRVNGADELLGKTLSLISEKLDSVVDNTTVLTILSYYIKNNLVQYKEPISEIVSHLDSIITEGSIDAPLKLLLSYSNSELAESPNYSLIDKIFLNLENTKDINLLLTTVTKIKDFDMSNYTNHDETLVYKFVTPEILTNLFSALTTEDDYETFVRNSNSHFQNEQYLLFAINTPSFMKYLWLHLSNNSVNVLMNQLEANLNDVNFQKVYFDTLNEAVEQVEDLDDILNRITALPVIQLKQLIPTNFITSIQSNIGSNPNALLPISNPLGTLVYMFMKEEATSEVNKEFLPILFNKAQFYSKLISEHPSLSEENDQLIIQLATVGEVASDSIFLDKYDEKTEERLLDLQTTIKHSVLGYFEKIPVKNIVDCYVNGIKSDEAFSSLLELFESKDTTSNIKFYAARVLKYILTQRFESLSASEFASFDFSKLARTPLKLAILISSCNKFLTSPNLTDLRNRSASNLIGLRTSKDILTIGLVSLLATNQFLELDPDFGVPNDFVLLPVSRLMMILTNLSNWLNSELAYDAEFIPIRVALMQFVETWIKSSYLREDAAYPEEVKMKIFELGSKLISESLNLVNSDSGDIALLYASLKLFIVLSRYDFDWDDELDDIWDELVEIFFKQAKKNQESHFSMLINGLLFRIFNKQVPSSKLESHYNTLYELINSSNSEMQRLATYLLHTLIPNVQDALVMDSILTKKTEDSEEAKLPEILVSNVTDHSIEDYVEFEDQTKVNRYLWSWLLIFDHFSNITQSIRQDYIGQLGDDVIFNFFNFVVTQLDMAKLNVPEGDYVKNYSIIDDQSTSEPSEESKKLLVNLLYFSCKYLGGNLTQTWFQSIRNKQLKTAVEKFVMKSVSPLLIDEILSGLNTKNSLEDDEFVIRLNKFNNEIKCFYEIDEQKIEMGISLPSNYPLSRISINGVSRLGVDEKKWKSWILSCQYVINIQNGTILEAIQHFKNNVKNNFADYDDCAICYSVLHAIDHSTPNKVCSTCKHNFHSACLYRWFKSSGSSTCPLCRSKFQFKKHS
ncbi:hypothetical protein CANARDRAFT_30626 [[Candida] arabinofermentans NRRL YB-2248]|uniref:E3 ubiquitin-protein ligase listerin n=1 Tax=[Candida] arabinofermentans NRRL YB-2248 TaxID=983967 RepID=A0A1E4STD8_9ASCO|nr:hypothetical protein CANARDRAFT_30626 [[Candida] arabinofermentans NRRL YB-2248]